MLLKKIWLILTLFLAGIAMTVWGIVTQPKEFPKVPLEVQQKARDVARMCNAQCAQQQTSCKNRSMEGCYRAAACRCECSLQHDPANVASNKWRQCVARNLERAQAENMRNPYQGALMPSRE